MDHPLKYISLVTPSSAYGVTLGSALRKVSWRCSGTIWNVFD